MKIKSIIAILVIVLLGGCSMFGGSGGETKMVGDEEITVGQVYISKGRAQCEDDSGRTLTETKSGLQNGGIKVFSSSCGVITGRMAPALCGATTLHINIHGIDERKYPEAEALGYEPVNSLEDGQGFEIQSCE